MAAETAIVTELDEHFAYRGPCAFCGHPDARHRLWDSLMDLDEDDERTAFWFDVPVAAVTAVRRVQPYREPSR